MRITRKCPLTGKTNSQEIAVTPDQLNNWYDGWLIQKAMPNLTPAEREFIKTGIINKEWRATKGDE